MLTYNWKEGVRKLKEIGCVVVPYLYELHIIQCAKFVQEWVEVGSYVRFGESGRSHCDKADFPLDQRQQVDFAAAF